MLYTHKSIYFGNLHAFFCTVNLFVHLYFETQASFSLCKVADVGASCAVDHHYSPVPSTLTPQVTIEVHGLLHQSSCSSMLSFSGITCWFFHGNLCHFRKNRLQFFHLIGGFSNEQNANRANSFDEHNLQHMKTHSGKFHLNPTVYDETTAHERLDTKIPQAATLKGKENCENEHGETVSFLYNFEQKTNATKQI